MSLPPERLCALEELDDVPHVEVESSRVEEVDEIEYVGEYVGFDEGGGREAEGVVVGLVEGEVAN